MGKATDFTDLVVWQKGHQLVRAIYSYTKTFPKRESNTLVNQLCRAGVSITSNVAEGHGRISYKEKARFYITARGSLTEVQNQLILARDVGYISEGDFFLIYTQTTEVARLLNGIIKYAHSRTTLK